ncbi:GNAT family N-acetyltransferase [Amycolatopsis anabasis]|uniref:GNAT family N-acetyltransferase n=1 Tax=Amycolatopsis anabasis TaxID=1840409 RepID=UPI00131D18C9|nr:GNAT family N-acetyltransferase [Amycolatopsis anabasis]
MDLTWRPLTLADAEAVAGLLAAANQVDPTGEHYSAEDVREDVASPNVDLAGGTTTAWDGDRLVAVVIPRVRDAANPVHQLRFEMCVHPGYRDGEIGARLIDWLVRAATELHRRRFPDAPLELHGSTHENQRWLTALFETHGFRHARSFVDMRADLSVLPPNRPLPTDLRLVRFEDKYDELTRQARNDTFAEHWGSTVQSPEAWRHMITGSQSFRPDLSFLLLSPGEDEVAAFVLSAHFESDTAATGIRELYVSNVGTRRAMRGRGVATALLGHTLAEAKAHGFQRSVLGVDVDNATGALGIYQRCGFSVTDRWYGWIRALP